MENKQRKLRGKTSITFDLIGMLLGVEVNKGDNVDMLGINPSRRIVDLYFSREQQVTGDEMLKASPCAEGQEVVQSEVNMKQYIKMLREWADKLEAQLPQDEIERPENEQLH